MKTSSSKLATLSILFLFLTAATTFAADDGNTRPRLNSAGGYGMFDIINETSVSGNVKGVSCDFPLSSQANLIFTVNGGSAQTINMPAGFVDANGDRHTGWIPMNIRFTSSIRVQVQSVNFSSQHTCYVSWALD